MWAGRRLLWQPTAEYTFTPTQGGNRKLWGIASLMGVRHALYWAWVGSPPSGILASLN